MKKKENNDRRDDGFDFPIMQTGVPSLDRITGGGIPLGQACLVAGASGTGKTILTLSFLVEGGRSGEPGVMVTFEESPEEHIRKARSFGWDLGQMVKDNLVELIYLRPVDLTVEEILQRIETAISRIGAKRVVINSISGFELAFAPTESGRISARRYTVRPGDYSAGVSTCWRPRRFPRPSASCASMP